jgi:hypothetical protein
MFAIADLCAKATLRKAGVTPSDQAGVTGAPPHIKSTVDHDHMSLPFEKNIVFQRFAAKSRLLRHLNMLSKQ